uniref:Minor capsid protein P11 C-terminal conserved region domain-containing protein n=1 Tax=viral metagenome TaxID=1070528 RepID=A0A6C0AP33_9ZZZZ
MATGDNTKNVLLVAVIGILGVYILLQYDPTLFGLLGRMEGFDGTGMGAKLNGKMTDNRSAASGSAQSSAGQTKSNSNVAGKPAQVKTTGDGYRLDPSEDKCPAGQSRQADGTCGVTIQAGPASKASLHAKKEGFADLAAMEGPAEFGSASAPAGCYPRDQLTPVQLLPADQDSIYAQQNPMGVGSLKGKNFLSAGALIGVNTVGQTLRNANLQLRSEPPNPQVSVSIFNQSTIQSDVNRRPLEVGCA